MVIYKIYSLIFLFKNPVTTKYLIKNTSDIENNSFFSLKKIKKIIFVFAFIALIFIIFKNFSTSNLQDTSKKDNLNNNSFVDIFNEMRKKKFKSLNDNDLYFLSVINRFYLKDFVKKNSTIDDYIIENLIFKKQNKIVNEKIFNSNKVYINFDLMYLSDKYANNFEDKKKELEKIIHLIPNKNILIEHYVIKKDQEHVYEDEGVFSTYTKELFNQQIGDITLMLIEVSENDLSYELTNNLELKKYLETQYKDSKPFYDTIGNNGVLNIKIHKFNIDTSYSNNCLFISMKDSLHVILNSFKSENEKLYNKLLNEVKILNKLLFSGVEAYLSSSTIKNGVIEKREKVYNQISELKGMDIDFNFQGATYKAMDHFIKNKLYIDLPNENDENILEELLQNLVLLFKNTDILIFGSLDINESVETDMTQKLYDLILTLGCMKILPYIFMLLNVSGILEPNEKFSVKPAIICNIKHSVNHFDVLKYRN